MSYYNVLKLAQKFSVKLADAANQPNIQIQEHFEKFKHELRSILNEMDGDSMTLRIKGADRSILKELGTLQQNLREKFKMLDDSRPAASMENILLYLFSKNVKTSLLNLHIAIQKFLKEHEIDFAPHAAFSQARVESITNLLKLAHITRNALQQQSTVVAPTPLKSEKEVYNPSAGAQDGTKVEKK